MTGRPAVGFAYRAAAAAALAVMRLQRWKITIEGAEHVPSSGGAVIAANHISYWDFFTVAMHPYVELSRPVRILAKASLFSSPVVGPIMRRAGHIPVRRGWGSAAFSAAVDALRRGELVLVMPEQTISPSFELLDLTHGASRMAAAAQVPLLPAVSWGSHRFHTIGRLPRPQWRLPVAVAFDRPMIVDVATNPRETTTALAERMQILLREVQAGYPDGTPAGAWWVPAALGGGAPTVDEARGHFDRLNKRWRQQRHRRARRQRSSNGG